MRFAGYNWYLIVLVDPGASQALAFCYGTGPQNAKAIYKDNSGDYRTNMTAVIWPWDRISDIPSYPL